MALHNPTGLVAAPDAILNVISSHVIGNKADVANETAAQASLVGLLRAALGRIDRENTAQAILPLLANGVVATAGAGAWDAYDAWVELDAGAGVPANDFVITGIVIDTPSAADLFQVAIGAGAALAEVQVCEVAFEIATDAGLLPVLPCTSDVIAGGTRIAARIACAGAVARTLGVKVLVKEI